MCKRYVPIVLVKLASMLLESRSWFGCLYLMFALLLHCCVVHASSDVIRGFVTSIIEMFRSALRLPYIVPVKNGLVTLCIMSNVGTLNYPIREYCILEKKNVAIPCSY